MSTIHTHDITQASVELGKPSKPKLARLPQIERSGVTYNGFAELAKAEQAEAAERLSKEYAKEAEERAQRNQREREAREPATPRKLEEPCHDGQVREVTLDGEHCLIGDQEPMTLNLSTIHMDPAVDSIALDDDVHAFDADAPGGILVPQGR